jgi:hypothetical protein
MHLYFAYGSNLLQSQMTERCPEHRFHSLAKLNDYRFLIGERGYATIEPSIGDCVHGVIYELSQSDEDTLDVREGVAYGSYTKEYLTMIGADGTIPGVLVYVDPRTQPSSPRDDYMARICAGAAGFDLPADYQAFLSSFN